MVCVFSLRAGQEARALPDLFRSAGAVHRYSPADALGDGVLIDASPTVREAGIKFPVALTAAVLFSFTSSCQRLGVDPWAYLQDLLTRLPTTPAGGLGEFLPDHWQEARRPTTSEPTPRQATGVPLGG
jgi:hypothetical protein